MAFGVGLLKADFLLISSCTTVPSPAEQTDLIGGEATTNPRVTSSPVVQLFLVALLVLLAGYMFLGRGFAHVGLPPFYVGEIVLFLGLVATAFVVFRFGLRIALSPVIVLLLVLIAWGAARTLPYLTTYGFDAVRDAVLWGYAFFALIIYVLIDRRRLLQGVRIYGWVIPAFAVWLPISMWIFWQIPTDPARAGSDVPLLWWKAPDMAVHVTGSIAYLVFCTPLVATFRSFAWRSLISFPLVWTYFVGWSLSRGALLASVTGLGVAALLGRSRNWAVLAGGLAILLVVQAGPALVDRASTFVTPVAQVTPAPGGSPPPSTSPTATPQPVSPGQGNGRATTFDQISQNLVSIFGGSSDAGLTGTVSFRLTWWTKIVNYTVLGPYFWLGKGFGINLADDDGFQPSGDGSLRAPHNSHLSALARMGVPGFVIWMLFQAAFGLGLLRQVFRLKRAGDLRLAAIGSWILVYWVAMMVNTSFDPYLESPQGGIWFWTLIGLGIVVLSLKPSPREATQ
jgi:hypothetical protein